MTTADSARETMGAMSATLRMPYTLTPGRATGHFLAELQDSRILGSQCDTCASVRVPPPYVYAEIVLEGTATRLIHTVGGLSAEDAREGGVRPGSRVQAVWSDRTTGSLSDIEYFRVLEDGE